MVTVAYLGPPGTFADAALHRFRADARTSALLDGAEAVPAGTPDEALDLVRAGAADYACVPFENSVDGTVNPTSDSLAEGARLQIFAENELDVVFSILVRPGTAAADVHTRASARPVPPFEANVLPALPRTMSGTSARSGRSPRPLLAVAAIVRQVADATTAGLTTVDANGDFQPILAAELPTLANGGVSEDFLTITWKLRPDLKWSDGTPLTSDDIKFTWEANANPDSGAVLSLGFETIDAIDTPQLSLIHISEPTRPY